MGIFCHYSYKYLLSLQLRVFSVITVTGIVCNYSYGNFLSLQLRVFSVITVTGIFCHYSYRYFLSLQLRVSDTLCEELEERPDAQEDCNIPCPRDCILSPWSPWSDCPNQCQEERTSPSIRLRQRNVLAQQGPGTGKFLIVWTPALL